MKCELHLVRSCSCSCYVRLVDWGCDDLSLDFILKIRGFTEIVVVKSEFSIVYVGSVVNLFVIEEIIVTSLDIRSSGKDLLFVDLNDGLELFELASEILEVFRLFDDVLFVLLGGFGDLLHEGIDFSVAGIALALDDF